jgi:hypothetical protein
MFGLHCILEIVGKIQSRRRKEQAVNRAPATVFLTLILIVLNAVFWLVFAILAGLGAIGIGSTAAASVMSWSTSSHSG